MHELPSVRSQGTLTHLNILHYADLVPCTFSFSSVRVQVQAVPFLVYEKRRWSLYVLLLDFVPLAFVFDCICNICSFFFFDPRTDSSKNDIFFLNLTKIECIVGELFMNRVKFMSVNSFVGGSYLSLGTFLNRFTWHIIRRENIVFPYFTSFPVNFLKEGQRAKEGKVLNCTHTLPLRKTSEKGAEKWKLSTVAANSSQMNLPWCDIFHKEGSTKTASE